MGVGGYGYGDGYGYGYGAGDGYGYGEVTLPQSAAWDAWHAVPHDLRLRYQHDGQRPVVAPGLLLECDDIELCKTGLHASLDRKSALGYCGGVICRVKVWGRVIVGGDKLVATHRMVVEVGA